MATKRAEAIVPPPAPTEAKSAIRLGARILRLWPLFTLVILGIGVFFGSQHLIHYFDRTAAVFDGAFLQRLTVAAEYFLAAVFSAMLIVYVTFRTVGRYLEHDGFYKDFTDITPIQRVNVFLYVFTVLTCLFAFCVWLVPIA